MQKRTGKFLVLLMAVCIALQVFAPVAALAAENEEPTEARAALQAQPLEDIICEYINLPGATFRVTAPTITGVQEADLLVWTDSEESAIRINTERALGGCQATVDIAEFGYEFGIYNYRIVERNAAGVIIAEGTGSCEIGPVDLRFGAEPFGDDQRVYRLSVSGGELPGRPSVWFEVKASEPGKDHVVTYPAMLTSGNYVSYANILAHGAVGGYEVTAFYGEPGVVEHELGETFFNVDGITQAAISVESDGSTGIFSFNANLDAPTGVTYARLAIWSQPDQSDICWVELQKNADGWNSPEFSIRNFEGGFGTYWVHVYATLASGLEQLATGFETNIVARNYVWQEKPSSGSYDIYIQNPSSTDNLRCAVWSETDGQDDVVWYPFTDEGSGIYKATAAVRRHKSSGSFIAHIWGDDEVLGACTFTVPSGEMLSAAEQRISNGCQRVYNAVGTDLYKNYLWVVNNLSYVRRYGHLSPPSGYTRGQWYAVEGLEKRSGNCYTYAATFCELARGLGYDAQYVEGAVYGVGQKWWPHGFVLIRLNGGTYICDPELQYASARGRNLYMQPVSNPRATYRW